MQIAEIKQIAESGQKYASDRLSKQAIMVEMLVTARLRRLYTVDTLYSGVLH